MGKLQLARDYFAAVVHWCPTDIEARKALALVCFKLGDKESAMEQWQSVLDRFPDDQMAKQGMKALERIQKDTVTRPKKQKKTKHHRRRKRGKKK
ncbi:MAG: hypothetical protein D6732_25855 [Methanobacteriota archaeon]|nr:MAG: hypothetical protein D6732_25855 [Euryarchaeota archaeon]